MTSRIQNRIRQVLRDHPDGMTITAISKLVKPRYGDPNPSHVRSALRRMVDAYVDRWVPGVTRPYIEVWRVVPVPPHCPRPEVHD